MTQADANTPRARGRAIVAHCLKLGFAAAGIAPAQPSARVKELAAWLAAGKHGTMDYFERDLELRMNPARLLEGARSFIMVADLYATRNDSPQESTPGRGRVARYAQGRDYHPQIKHRLHELNDHMRVAYPGSRFRAFVDTVPIMERELAVLAGLGWQAKNTMLIHPRLGSYMLIGGIATTLELQPPEDQPTPADHCGSCTRCIDACPTNAITPYSVDGSRCVSYLTIEHRTLIDPALHEGMVDYVYGCDICQEVCPHNSPRTAEGVGSRGDAYEPRVASFDLLHMVKWDPLQRAAAVHTSAMKRANLAMMRRNALIAAGNWLMKSEAPLSNREALHTRIREIASDPAETSLVRDTALQVLGRIGTVRGSASVVHEAPQ